MQRISFSPKANFGDLEDIKSFKFVDAAWQHLNENDLKKLSLHHILYTDLRLLVEFKFNAKTYRLATHAKDAELVRKKYPDDYCVSLDQIQKWFRNSDKLTQEDIKLFIPLSIFNAKIK